MRAKKIKQITRSHNKKCTEDNNFAYYAVRPHTITEILWKIFMILEKNYNLACGFVCTRIFIICRIAFGHYACVGMLLPEMEIVRICAMTSKSSNVCDDALR